MTKFKSKVLQAVKTIPRGKVASYGQIALMVGMPRAARQVGWVLHEYGDITPWWRVINNAGRISTTCLEHSALSQKDHLVKEGIQVKSKLKIDIERYRYRPSPTALKKLLLEDEYIESLIKKYMI